MISIHHPSILNLVVKFGYGLLPVYLKTKDKFFLIIKGHKELILTARLNQEISFYLVPDVSKASYSIGMITAFFDDHDEPLVMFTPLYSDDQLQIDLIKVLSQETFDIYFFDENNREMMGVRAILHDAERVRSTLKKARFNELHLDKVGILLEAMSDWFGRRVASDDKNAFLVRFERNLYPDDLLIMDARPESNDFHGADGNLITSLERQEPGAFQERDIIGLLKRSFLSETIFLNPIRLDSGTEFADIVCLTSKVMLVVQAKDSPNTESSLRRTIDRKKAVTRSHIKKAAKQMQGALSYVKELDTLNISTSNGEHLLDIKGRTICGVVLVREMFDDDYKACSAPVLAMAKGCKVPCVLIDFSALHMMTLHFDSPTKLINVMFGLFKAALQNGEYPKPRFLGQPEG